MDTAMAAMPRAVKTTGEAQPRPMVYADDYIKVGEDEWHLDRAAACAEWCAQTEVQEEALENGFGIVFFARGSNPCTVGEGYPRMYS